jgi:tRNA pseudouridine38-40 synthase
LVRNIRLTLAYDGTEFSGWQVQKNARTVQGAIEGALERMHGHPVRIQGAGRTDSGVHASGQVGNFFSDLDSIDPPRWHIALNSYLPPDVRALASREAPETFNAKNSARQRVYRYYLYTGIVGPPHLRLYCWKIRQRPDLQTLNDLAAVFLGEHDFTTFAAAGDVSRSKVRRVDTACFFQHAGYDPGVRAKSRASRRPGGGVAFPGSIPGRDERAGQGFVSGKGKVRWG